MVDKNVNFYDETNRMDYGKANEYKKFHNAYDAEGGDCSVYKDTNKDTNGDNYIPCAHLSMEVWFPNGELTEAQNLGKAEQLQFNGQIGHQGWHITQFSIKRDPSLGNHFGMRGETNRQKLASTFKFPTTWKHYCTFVSSSNCTKDDGIAMRPPAADGSEDEKYFFLGAYTGYFRLTNKSDCDKTKECVGHFLNYP